MPSPLLWGDEGVVNERFKNAGKVSIERQSITFEFDMSPDDVVSFWREYYGPTQRAFAALDGQPEKQDEMHKDLSDLWRCANKAIGNVTIVDSEYLKVLITQL